MSLQPPALAYPVPASTPSPQVVAESLDRLAYAALCAFVFALTWEDTVPLLGGFVISRWLGLAALGITVMRAAVLPRSRLLTEVHYWMLAFAAWSCLSVFWTLDWDSTAYRVGTYAQLLVLAWLIWEVASTEARVLGLLQAYVFGTLVCAVGTIGNLLAGRTSGDLAVDAAVTYKSARYTMEGLNPNDLGLMLALSIPMTLYLLVRRQKRPLTTVVCWLQFTLTIITILLSGSRGALMAACAAVLMFPLVLRRMPRWQKTLAVVACACAAGLGLFLVPPDTWARIFRLGVDMTEGTMTHRTQIWSASMELFRDHPFLGVGSGAHPVAVLKILARPLVAHNTFLSVLVELGVAGALIFLGLLASTFYCALRMRGLERSLWLLTLATWCIGVCGGTWEYRKATWFLLSLLVAHAFVGKRGGVRAAKGYS